MYGGVYYGTAPTFPAFGGARVVQRQPGWCSVHSFKWFGAVLAILAAASLALGIANVVLTRETYCKPWMDGAPVYCSTTKEPYIWTWVASGIWGSVPIFLAGLLAMCASSNPANWARLFAFFVFVSAIVFAPGMAVLSSIEVWRGSAADWNFYTLDNGVKEGNIMPPDGNPYQAKFALPLVIAIIGCILFIMTGIVTLTLCCCRESLGVYLPWEQDVFFGSAVAPAVVEAPQPVVSQEVYYPGRPQVKNYNEINVYRPAVYNPPVRYNPIGTGVTYGNFPSRANFGVGVGGYFGAGFYGGSNPAYTWQ